MMHFRIRQIWKAAALLLVCAFNAELGDALIATTATYKFVGQCGDCVPNGPAILVLRNYTLNSDIFKSNFVSFQYSSDHVSYNLTLAGYPNLSISGRLPATLLTQPAAANINISADGQSPTFVTDDTGGWCTGNECGDDYGSGGTWSPYTPPTTVPALSDSMLICLAVAMGVLGALLLRKTRRRISD